MKENDVNPLTFNCEFSRLTRLFQRPLQMKYYTKKEGQGDSGQVQGPKKEAAEDPDRPDQPQFINEEGDFLEGQNDDLGDAGAPDDGFQQEEMMNGAGDAQPEVELGFEEAALEEGQGFGSFSAQRQQSDLRDMFKTHQMKRFDAAGGANQQIHLN